MSIASLDQLRVPAHAATHPSLTEAEAARTLDLAQQGFLPAEIAELLDVSQDSAEAAIEAEDAVWYVLRLRW